MKKIITERRTGKTTELINISSETNDCIVCDSRDVKWIVREAQEMGLIIPLPLTYGEFINRRYNGINIKGFLIDDVDRLLKKICFSVPIKFITMTVMEDEVHKIKLIAK